MNAADITSQITWPQLMEARQFAQECFLRWAKRALLAPGQATLIESFYTFRREAWAKAAEAGESVPQDLGLPPARAVESPDAQRLRLWTFVDAEILRHRASQRLSLAQAHALRAEVRERMATLRRRIEADELPEASSAEETRLPRQASRHLLEIALDPRNIHWLLALGGALMVTGLVILLWYNNFFTPPVMALALGAVNLALLLGGWAIMRGTRYQTAGRALILLVCLIMPLNLWYYHSHGLMTVEGHLWVAAVALSALYAASAYVLRDELFVYVFCAGIALTGLLILADLPPSPQKFWEIASPASLLVVLGLMAIHAERAFPEREGPFSRKRFGLAFFWSGHALLAGGLLLLLGAQIASDWFYEPLFRTYYERWHAARTPIVTEHWGQVLALCLVLAGTYAYIYSDLVVRRVGVYIYLAAATLLWLEVLALEALHLHLDIPIVIGILAGTALVANAVYAGGSDARQLVRAFPILALFLGFVAVGLGLMVYSRALSRDLRSVWQPDAPPGWNYVAAMALAALSARFGAFVTRQRLPQVSIWQFFTTGAATMVAAVAALAALGLTEWEQHAPWMMLIPIAYLVAARMYRGRPSEMPVVWVAHIAALVMLFSSLASAVPGFTQVAEQQPLNLALAIFFAEATIFYGLAAAWHKHQWAVHLSAAMACATLWQLLTYNGVSSEAYTLTFALAGLGLLIGYRFAVLERFAADRLADAAFQSGNVLLSLAFLASIFMGASRLATTQVQWTFVRLCLVLLAINLASLVLIRSTDWRRWYVVMAVFQAFLTLLAIQVLSDLSIYRKLEIFGVAAGLCLLFVGHVGWYREQDRENDLVSLSLFLGSVLAGLPLALATLVDRWHNEFLAADDLGFLAISVILLTTGFVFRLKSTTLSGAGLTILYFLMLLLYVPWSRLNTVAVAITTGGGLIFATGVVLSLYRDRLLALPESIERREGIFRVLGWR